MPRNSETSAAPKNATKYIVLAAMGAFLDGYDLLVIGIALLTLRGHFDMTSTETGLVTAAAFAGMAIGAFFFGSLADRFGRKPLFLMDLILFIVVAILSGIVQNIEQLIVIRFVMGLAIGIDMPTSTAILAEFSQDKNRGRNGLFMQGFWFMGGVAATVIGLVIYIYAGEDSWRWILMSGAVPALIVLIMRQGMPETEYWLKQRAQREQANTSRQLRGGGSFRDLLSGHRRSIIFLTFYWFLANLTGSSLLLYTPTIAESTFGLAGESTYIFSAGLSVCYTVALFIIAFKIVDVYGRRTVALVGWVGVAVMTLVLAFSSESVVVLVAAFAIGTTLLQAAANGPFWPWSVELFPTRLRGTGQGVASAAGKVGGFVGTALFPGVMAAIGWQASMLTFVALFVIGAVVVAVLAPETKGQALAEQDLPTRTQGNRG